MVHQSERKNRDPEPGRYTPDIDGMGSSPRHGLQRTGGGF